MAEENSIMPVEMPRATPLYRLSWLVYTCSLIRNLIAGGILYGIAMLLQQHIKKVLDSAAQYAHSASELKLPEIEQVKKIQHGLHELSNLNQTHNFSDYTLYVVYGLMVLLVVRYIYKQACIRSVVVFYDQDGIWLRHGILPWNKVLRGIKWRDLDRACYVPGFSSWLTRSYTVIIKHRFTKSAEIVIDNVYCGHNFVKQVNALHVHYVHMTD